MKNVKHLVNTVFGGLILIVGVALLVLPGPGLLLVLLGLVMLSTAFPRLERLVGPVRRRAMKAAEDSVSSGWRVAATALLGAVLIGAGVAWGLVDGLPFSGWHTGASVILSGLIVLALLVYSHRNHRRRLTGSRP
jgi:hypothetical protein